MPLATEPIPPSREPKRSKKSNFPGIARAIADPKFKQTLEEEFGLPFQKIAEAAELAQSTEITIAEAIEKVKAKLKE